MRSLLSALAILVMLSLGTGCMESSLESATPTAADAPSDAARGAAARMPVSEAAVQQEPPLQVERQLIKTGRLSLRVDEYDAAIVALRDTVARFDAYLSGEQEQRSTYRVENTLIIRVASAEFDALVAAVSRIPGRVEARSIDVDDVTEEYVDTQARLRSRRAAEERYLAILQRASTIEDILTVQRQLDQVREEIERVEGRLRFLQDRVGFSTLTVSLYQATEFALTEGPGFFAQVVDAFEVGWRGVLAIVLYFVTVWPFLLLIVAGTWFYQRWRRNNPLPERPAPRSVQRPSTPAPDASTSG